MKLDKNDNRVSRPQKTNARISIIIKTITDICVVSPLLGQTTFATSDLASPISLLLLYQSLSERVGPSEAINQPIIKLCRANQGLLDM